MYWAIRYNEETSIVGPFEVWQRACMSQYGHISIDMGVKLLATDSTLLRKKKWVEREISRVDGWFKPFIPNDHLGITMSPSKALGPKEIGERMLDISHRLRSCENREDAGQLMNEATPYLRMIPIEAAKKFSEYYNLFVRSLDVPST